MDLPYLIALVVVVFVLLYLILGSFFTVRTAEVAVITRFGKFLRSRRAGIELEAAVLRFRGGHW